MVDFENSCIKEAILMIIKMVINMLVVVIRSIILYSLIIFAIRLMGKRQLGELQPSELVVTILVSNMAALPIENPNLPMLMGVIPILFVVSIEVITSSISLRCRGFRNFMSGNAKIVIKDGKINQAEMKNVRYSIDDLMESLRENGIFDIREVQFAIVETTGKINIYQKHHAQCVTTGMMEIEGQSKNPPSVIISDGEFVSDGLNASELNKNWVLNILKKEKIQLKDVFLFTADETGDYHIIPKE